MTIGVKGTKTFWEGTDNFYAAISAQCQGCGSLLAAKLALRAIFETAPDALIYGRSCGGGRSELQTGGRIAQDGSGLLGMEVAMRLRHSRPRTVVCLSGEGRTLDMGFGDFVSAIDRDQKVTWIILDNQSYAASGSHITSTTPIFARSKIYTAARGGFPGNERNIPLMMLHSQARYVATATPAYVKDYISKVREALKLQPSYVHVVVPCQVGWGYEPDMVVHISRLLVQTGLLPLWEHKDGALKRTVRTPAPMKVPVQEYLKLQRRYSHVSRKQVEEIERHIAEMNTLIDDLEEAGAQ